MASSLVGTIIIYKGPYPFIKLLGLYSPKSLYLSITGSAYAKVFPEPVLSLAIKSFF